MPGIGPGSSHSTESRSSRSGDHHPRGSAGARGLAKASTDHCRAGPAADLGPGSGAAEGLAGAGSAGLERLTDTFAPNRFRARDHPHSPIAEQIHPSGVCQGRPQAVGRSRCAAPLTHAGRVESSRRQGDEFCRQSAGIPCLSGFLRPWDSLSGYRPHTTGPLFVRDALSGPGMRAVYAQAARSRRMSSRLTTRVDVRGMYAGRWMAAADGHE